MVLHPREEKFGSVNTSDPAESEKIIGKWRPEEQVLLRPIMPNLFHMRSLQEAQTVAQFLKNADISEIERFNKFLKCKCEQKSIL
jgi:hypothetical protein